MRPKFHFIDVMTHSVCLRQNKLHFHSLNPQKFNCPGFACGGGGWWGMLMFRVALTFFIFYSFPALVLLVSFSILT